MRVCNDRRAYRAALAAVLCVCAAGLLAAGLNRGRPSRPVSAVGAEARPRTAETQTEPGGHALEYKVWRVFPPGRGGYSLALVSVNPRHFNRDDMAALAAQLNKELARETRLKAALFDNESVPRNFSLGGAEIPTLYAAQRGLYFLDRGACREYIEYAPRSGAKGSKRVTIKRRCPPPRK